ncbi:hypothetical protein [Streptomyces roseochromogenus]|uniref:Uncharacterized protein n=1 Tax=Streptomyces roseochromogenus subsp. oscitans DS 12.976 TaxID=1352936 RepID=V6JMI8_STRRC|nr:hypothetical protein [Streptomyces roseochromogenus]EST18059.1 hypothetical protein M878_45690 [Streptomyces roseochromogenus subsp. oscitans DS 12.976]
MITANRAAYTVITTARRSTEGVTLVTLINNGGRSRLQYIGDNGTHTKHLAPVLHRQIARAVEDAAHTYARTRYGARKNWPARIVVTHDGTLDCADAAPELGDHVFNGRVYHFSDAAATAAHRAMDARRLSASTQGLLRPAYDVALATFAAHLGLPANYRNLYALARSYTRRHPATVAA